MPKVKLVPKTGKRKPTTKKLKIRKKPVKKGKMNRRRMV